MKIEIAAFNFESALIADQNGADRIEYCASWEEGGLTPDIKEVNQLLNTIKTPLTIMIRPRGGNFLYSDSEFEEMVNSIKQFRSLPILGFVFGVLTEDNQIDMEKNKVLIELAQGKMNVMHRAFDKTKDMEKSLEDIINCGFHTLLTSGHEKNVEKGMYNLKKLNSKSHNRIQIMPGGGLRSGNIGIIHQTVQTEYYHSSGIIDDSGIANPEEIKRLKLY